MVLTLADKLRAVLYSFIINCIVLFIGLNIAYSLTF